MSYIGNQPISAAFLTDTFSGTGSATVFTMSVAPANTSSILVVVTGVTQDPSTYSVSGTTLTFSAAPPSGTSNISVRYLGIPASGVTTTAYRTVTDFTATAGQTTFSPASYTVGYINVYRNGVRLASTDYTATTGTTVVLNNACTVGDSVVTESFYVSSVLNAIPATAGSISSTYLASGLTLTSPTLTSPTLSSPAITGGTWTSPSGSTITSGTVQAPTSGTSVTFTGIPSWVKRVTIMMTGVTYSTSVQLSFQLGSGSLTTSGYASSGSIVTTGGGANATNSTGTGIQTHGPYTGPVSGQLVLSLVNSATNLWVGTGLFAFTGATAVAHTSGYIALSGALDRVAINTIAGTATISAGTVNILYE